MRFLDDRSGVSVNGVHSWRMDGIPSDLECQLREAQLLFNACPHFLVGASFNLLLASTTDSR
jgi:hypothetical protein